MKRMKKSAVACLMVASTMALNIPNVRLNTKGISHIPLHDRDINFTKRSLFIPKMTIHQQNTILYNSLPLLFLNTDNNCFPFYNASNFWKNPYCSTGYTNTPSTLTTNKDNALTANGFVANCSSVAGITTYNPNVTTDAGLTSFVPEYNNLNVGNVTMYNVMGLTCNINYYYRVRAGNPCGTSLNSNIISVTTGVGALRCLAIGGYGSDYGHSIIQTSDGGYAVAGRTHSFGYEREDDLYVVKLDGSGNIQWTRNIGGEDDDAGCSIIKTSDGGYAVAGWTKSFGAGEGDIYVVKLDGSGNIQWTRTIGGGDFEEGYSIIQTSDGGYAVAGYTKSFGAKYYDVYVVKLDGSGNIQWTRTIGGTDWDKGYSIIQTSDGGYAVAGFTSSFGAGKWDVYVVKLDGSGNIQWTRTIGGVDWDEGYSIIQTSDGGYAVAGKTKSFGAGNDDVYVVKLDGSGNIRWTRTIGGENNDEGHSIIQTSDGGYAVAGFTSSFGAGKWDVYVVKLDGSGNIQWTRIIGGGVGRSLIQTSDGGYAVAGTTSSFGGRGNDIYVVKLDENGNLGSCPGGCQVSSGGTAGSGGNVSSGGTAGNGGKVSSGGNAGSGGGTLTKICP
jgi:hypothetical protein